MGGAELISCKTLYTIGIFLGILTGQAAFLGILPERAGIAFVAFTMAYIAAIAYYCHEEAHPAANP